MIKFKPRNKGDGYDSLILLVVAFIYYFPITCIYRKSSWLIMSIRKAKTPHKKTGRGKAKKKATPLLYEHQKVNIWERFSADRFTHSGISLTFLHHLFTV